MTKQEILEQMKRELEKILPELAVEEITMESRLSEDLGLNSLRLMLLALVMEEDFGIRFDADVSFTTVDDACAYVHEKLSARETERS